VQSTAINGEMTGESSFFIDISDRSVAGTGETQKVPGIGLIHIIVLIMAATAIRLKSI
jgi:hypothetical protein